MPPTGKSARKEGNEISWCACTLCFYYTLKVPLTQRHRSTALLHQTQEVQPGDVQIVQTLLSFHCMCGQCTTEPWSLTGSYIHYHDTKKCLRNKMTGSTNRNTKTDRKCQRTSFQNPFLFTHDFSLLQSRHVYAARLPLQCTMIMALSSLHFVASSLSHWRGPCLRLFLVQCYLGPRGPQAHREGSHAGAPRKLWTSLFTQQKQKETWLACDTKGRKTPNSSEAIRETVHPIRACSLTRFHCTSSWCACLSTKGQISSLTAEGLGTRRKDMMDCYLHIKETSHL